MKKSIFVLILVLCAVSAIALLGISVTHAQD